MITPTEIPIDDSGKAAHVNPTPKAVVIAQKNATGTAIVTKLLTPSPSSVQVYDSDQEPNTIKLDLFASQDDMDDVDIALDTLSGQLDAATASVNDLAERVKLIEEQSLVAAIVASYEDMQALDKTKFTANDIVKVLADEQHEGNTSYYKLVNNDWDLLFVVPQSSTDTKDQRVVAIKEYQLDTFYFDEELPEKLDEFNYIFRWSLQETELGQLSVYIVEKHDEVVIPTRPIHFAIRAEDGSFLFDFQPTIRLRDGSVIVAQGQLNPGDPMRGPVVFLIDSIDGIPVGVKVGFPIGGNGVKLANPMPGILEVLSDSQTKVAATDQLSLVSGQVVIQSAQPVTSTQQITGPDAILNNAYVTKQQLENTVAEGSEDTLYHIYRFMMTTEPVVNNVLNLNTPEFNRLPKVGESFPLYIVGTGASLGKLWRAICQVTSVTPFTTTMAKITSYHLLVPAPAGAGFPFTGNEVALLNPSQGELEILGQNLTLSGLNTNVSANNNLTLSALAQIKIGSGTEKVEFDPNDHYLRLYANENIENRSNEFHIQVGPSDAEQFKRDVVFVRRGDENKVGIQSTEPVKFLNGSLGPGRVKAAAGVEADDLVTKEQLDAVDLIPATTTTLGGVKPEPDFRLEADGTLRMPARFMGVGQGAISFSDWNDCTIVGTSYASVEAANAPVPGWCYGWVVNIQPGFCSQFLVSLVTKLLYKRDCDNGTWGAWTVVGELPARLVGFNGGMAALTVTDWDDVYAFGNYKSNPGASNVPPGLENTPIAGIVFIYDVQQVTQLVRNVYDSTNKLYIRSRIDGVWGNWSVLGGCESSEGWEIIADPGNIFDITVLPSGKYIVLYTRHGWYQIESSYKDTSGNPLPKASKVHEIMVVGDEDIDVSLNGTLGMRVFSGTMTNGSAITYHEGMQMGLAEGAKITMMAGGFHGRSCLVINATRVTTLD